MIPGVGPVTQEQAAPDRDPPVGDLQGFALDELAQIVGRAHAQGLVELAYARDDRPVEPERETKSISVEDTFETDLVDPAELRADPAPRRPAGRRPAAGGPAVRPDRHDQGPAARLLHPHPLPDPAQRDRPAARSIGAMAQSLLAAVDVTAAYGCSASGWPG